MTGTTTKYTWLRLLLVGLLFSVAPLSASAANDVARDDTTRKAITPTGDTADVVPGVVVVGFKDGTAPAEGAPKSGLTSFDRLAAAHRIQRIDRAYPFLEGIAAKQGLPESGRALQRIYYLRYDGPQRPQAVAKALAEDPNVEFAEPEYIYRPAETVPPLATPNDPLFSNMTHLQRMQLPAAWDVVKGEQGNVIIGIVDGGTDWRHPDLQANVWTNPDETPNNGVDDDNNGFVDDVHGWNFANESNDPTGLSTQPSNSNHGTFVAGNAAAVTNNGLGLAGTSWNATFMPIAAACPQQDDAICFGFPGIIYAASNGATIINASWGGPESSDQGERAIAFAVDMGALVIAAAGNDGLNTDLTPFFPASFDKVLSVGSTGKNNDGKAGFSNFGVSADIFAPGSGVESTSPGGSFGTGSGTSFSSPLVAGIAALVKTQNPNFSVDQLREQVRVTGDNIDAANPNFAGRLGRGRVNALRAVTVTDLPAIRITDVTFTESGNDGGIESGETVQLTLTFTNYLAAAGGVLFTLRTDDPFVTITSGAASIGSLASGASQDITFTFTVANNTPDGRALRFFVDIEAGSYTDAGVVELVANETAVATHRTSNLEVSITNEGNIGFLNFSGDSGGEGFVYLGRNLLFEGGLLVATGPAKVSDSVRGTGDNQEDDLVLQEGTTLEIISPAEFTDQQGQVSFTDDNATSPIGVLILQDSYIDTAPENDDFIIFRYTITNTTDQVITDLHAGLFFDWDVDAFDAQNDVARFNEERQFGYIEESNGGFRVGTHLLTDDPLSYRAIDNPTEIYRNATGGGFTEQEKFDFLSNGIQRRTINGSDVSQITGAGPFILDPGASVQVAFAIIAGQSENALLASVDAAQALWDNVIDPMQTGVDDSEPAPRSFALEAAYPNPAITETSIGFTLTEPSHVQLTIYDVLGRAVQTLTEAPMQAGAHTVDWDGRDENGQRVAGGVYFYRITATGPTSTFTRSRSVVVVK